MKSHKTLGLLPEKKKGIRGIESSDSESGLQINEEQIPIIKVEGINITKEADEVIRKEASKYRYSLLNLAKKDAESIGIDFITIANVRRILANNVLKVRQTRDNINDIYLAVGGMLLGACLPFIYNLNNPEASNPNIIMIVVGIIGALSLGLGIRGKSKKE